MNGWRLFRWILWRGIISGAILGALFGTTITSFYTLMGAIGICFISFFAGAILGAGLGGVLAAINGLALVILTRLFTKCNWNARLYRWSALVTALMCTLPSGLIAVYVLFGNFPYVDVPVTILATITAGFFAWRLPNASAPHSKESQLPVANAVLFYVEK